VAKNARSADGKIDPVLVYISLERLFSSIHNGERTINDKRITRAGYRIPDVEWRKVCAHALASDRFTIKCKLSSIGWVNAVSLDRTLLRRAWLRALRSSRQVDWKDRWSALLVLVRRLVDRRNWSGVKKQVCRTNGKGWFARRSI